MGVSCRGPNGLAGNVDAFFTPVPPRPRGGAHLARKEFVNACHPGVKVPSGPVSSAPSGYTLASFGRRWGGPAWREHVPMADLAYAVLLVAAFGILVLTLRGLEKL
jgi:hypothetical protein